MASVTKVMTALVVEGVAPDDEVNDHFSEPIGYTGEQRTYQGEVWTVEDLLLGPAGVLEVAEHTACSGRRPSWSR